MLKRILMLSSIGATGLVFGVLAVQQLLDLFEGGTAQHLLQHPQHPMFHTTLTGTFALLSAISGAVLYRLRRTR